MSRPAMPASHSFRQLPCWEGADKSPIGHEVLSDWLNMLTTGDLERLEYGLRRCIDAFEVMGAEATE